MKTPYVLAIIVSAGCVAAVQAQEMPKRKPGLWEIGMQMPGMGASGMTSQQCVDEKTDAEMQRRAMQPDQQKCTQQSMKKLSNGWESTAVCQDGSSTMSVHAVATGDFNSSYRVDMDAKFSPPKNGRSEMKTSLTAKYLGACPADLKPGQMKINGMVIDPMAARGGGAQGMPDMRNMTPEQRKAFTEQMMKQMQQMKDQMRNTPQ